MPANFANFLNATIYFKAWEFLEQEYHPYFCVVDEPDVTTPSMMPAYQVHHKPILLKC